MRPFVPQGMCLGLADPEILLSKLSEQLPREQGWWQRKRIVAHANSADNTMTTIVMRAVLFDTTSFQKISHPLQLLPILPKAKLSEDFDSYQIHLSWLDFLLDYNLYTPLSLLL